MAPRSIHNARRSNENLPTYSTREVYSPSGDDPETSPRRWWHNLPLFLTVTLILAPHPSWLLVVVKYHFQRLHRPYLVLTHIGVTYTLTFLTFTSLIVCIARDPGPVRVPGASGSGSGAAAATRSPEMEEEEMSLAEALMGGSGGGPEEDDFDFLAPGKWCRKCWAPKPERTHHCSTCGRCILKQDHHCPWLGSRCIGHRTYPAFVHFLSCITLLALYIAVVCILALRDAFNNPMSVDETTPIHEMLLALAGIVFTFVMGSFLGYHLYLITTNQTTIENISPFLLLRHLPPLPPLGHSLSDPPLEPELSYAQRRLVKDAHGAIRLYDLGWRKNWQQVFGWKGRYGLVRRLVYGGASNGDGVYFARNRAADELLERLAQELVKADKDRY